MVGSYGTVIFTASNLRISTFNNFKRDISSKYAEHEVIAAPPKLEYLHRDLEEISFEMIFHKDLGINPAEEVDKLKKMCNEGVADYLVLDNKVYGDLEFVITEISENVLYFDKNGKVVANKISVKLKEYVR